MVEPKLEVPAELRDLAEKTIDQAEKAFGMFFDAASKSMTSMPGAGTDISKQALSFTEQNMKAAFDHARKLVHATDLQEAMRILVGLFAQSVHQCRRTYETDHRQRGYGGEGRDQGQVLAIDLSSSRDRFTEPVDRCPKSVRDFRDRARYIVIRRRRPAQACRVARCRSAPSVFACSQVRPSSWRETRMAPVGRASASRLRVGPEGCDSRAVDEQSFRQQIHVLKQSWVLRDHRIQLILFVDKRRLGRPGFIVPQHGVE